MLIRIPPLSMNVADRQKRRSEDDRKGTWGVGNGNDI